MTKERPENPDRPEEEPQAASEVSEPQGDTATREAAETPGVGEAPEVTEKPGAGEAPEATEKPGAGEAREATKTPEADTTPEATETSDIAEALEAEGTPEVGEAPKAAKTPDIAEAPDATETPQLGKTPETADDVPAVAEPGQEVPAAAGGRPRTAVIVASVAAAVLLVGGGGAWLAAGAGEKQAGAGSAGAPPPLALDSGPGAGAAGIAVGEPDPNGGVHYVVGGELPDGPRSAPVQVAEGKVGKDAVARLAEALGVDGAPVADGDGWRAGEREGGPVLRVAGAGGDWSYSRYAAGTDNCRKITACSQDPGAPADKPVDVAEAERVARPVLKALGQDDAKIDASQVMGAQRVVNADPVVGGLPTYGWTTGLTVDEKGDIVGAHGMLGRTTKGDTYPVLSAADTVKLMNKGPAQDHRMGIGGCASPVPLKDRDEQPCGASTGSPTAPKADSVTVEKAVFGLAARPVDGRPALVPSWLFEVRGSAARGGFTVAYPAIDPKYLASPAAKEPKGRGVTVEGYRAEGRELTVRFIGGVCAEYRASARESAGRVTVTVTEKPRPGNCIAIGKEYTRTVPLDAPLADREVVGTDGDRVPKAEHSLTP
ncbi:hypothetical protein [Streptomyces sp. NPDC085596]|uniref:hypothetical protein n=1 Tax=Streptomyces sp. NPDC085596 TaxID=3365731 RepID=UPI0037D35BF6